MSEPRTAVRERPGGYQRSSSGLIGAMVATVLAVLAFVGFRALTSDNAATPPPAVDWQLSLKAARADGKLQVLAPPATLPSRWKATSVSFQPGSQPAWHLGLLTSGGKYLGIDESRDDLGHLVRDKVDENASTGPGVTIDGARWQVFTDSGGDYALGRTVTHAGAREAQLVGGSAPPGTVRTFVGTLDGG